MFSGLAFWKNKSHPSKENQEALINAIKAKDFDAVVEVCERDPRAAMSTTYQGHSSLIFAANSGEPRIVMHLLEQGLDVNGVSKVKP